MAVEFNHTIIASHDKQISAHFLAEVLGLPSPTPFGPFLVVKTANNVSLDYMSTTQEFQPRHYAFLVSESDFDEIFKRIEAKNITYWADHKKKQAFQINHNDGGRGLYFHDPNDHFLEILTRPYGSGGSE